MQKNRKKQLYFFTIAFSVVFIWLFCFRFLLYFFIAIACLLNLLYKNTASPYRTGGEIIYKHFEMQQYIISALCGILKVIQ